MIARFCRPLSTSAVLALVLVSTQSATAERPRAFVATYGVDTNPCAPEAPCRTFSRAAAEAQDNGEIVVLNSGGYGPFAVTKSVKIYGAPGVFAGIAIVGGDGIEVNAPGERVRLANLNLIGFGATRGIDVTAVSELQIDNCLIANMLDDGVDFHPTSYPGLLITNTTFLNCGQKSVNITNTVGHNEAVIEDCIFEENTEGVHVAGNATVAIRNCVFNGNASGTYAEGATNRIMVENCIFTHNDIGVYGGGKTGLNNSVTWVSNCTITHNSNGVASHGGVDVLTFSNNRVVGNTAGEIFPGTVAQK